VPRTIAQAEAMDAGNVQIDAVLSIEVPDETIIKRLGGRRSCPECGAIFHVVTKKPKQDGICDVCGTALVVRKDDETETIKNRLQTYHKETAPLIDYYKKQGKLKEVGGDFGIAEQTAEVFKVLAL